MITKAEQAEQRKTQLEKFFMGVCAGIVLAVFIFLFIVSPLIERSQLRISQTAGDEICSMLTGLDSYRAEDGGLKFRCILRDEVVVPNPTNIVIEPELDTHEGICVPGGDWK